MKASEVLKRYAAGDRNFRGANLRGQSFKGQDLQGADFSEADIRSADFTDAILAGANFTGAKCGLQKQWAIFLTIISWLLAGISGFISIVFAAKFFPIFDDSSNFNAPILNLVCLILIFILYEIFIRQEIEIATGALVIGVLLIAAGAGIILIGVLAGIVGFIVGEIAVAVAEPRAGFIALLSAVVGFIAGVAEIVEELGLATITVAAVGVLVVKGVSDGWYEMKGKKRDMWIHPFVVAFAAMGGTSFFGANLTDAIFTRAELKSTDLRLANITRVCWHQAIMLNRVFSRDTYLQYRKVRQWLIGEGEDKNLDRVNLRGVNFQGIKNLTDASFIRTDLSEANLRDTDLSGAKLVKTKLDSTDLTGAILTGACIEDWGITADTELRGIRCKYIFMRLPTKEDPNRCRKPDNWEEAFEDGDFTDFIKPIVDTLDLYHNRGVDPRAIAISFKKLAENNPDAELEIVAVEKRGEDKFLLRAKTTPEADKSQLSAEYFETYNQLKTLCEVQKNLLIEKDNRIQDLKNMFNTALKRPSFYAEKHHGDIKMSDDRKIEGDYVEGNKTDSSRTQNITNSTIDNSGAGAFSLGDIRGNVTNTINQLPNFANEPNKKELKELLSQLQTAVLETELDEEEKAESLEQIQTIASSLTNSQDSAVKKTAKTSMKLLRGTAAALPKGAAMVTICNQLPDLINKIFN